MQGPTVLRIRFYSFIIICLTKFHVNFYSGVAFDNYFTLIFLSLLMHGKMQMHGEVIAEISK